MSALKKILVVDDDPVIGKSFDRVLSGKGYAVITAASGEEAMAKLKNEHYDAVFADIKMPGISGLDVAEQVKASQPWMPVVIITGFGSPGNEARAEAAGVSDFVRKPLTPEMIEQMAAKTTVNSPEVPQDPVKEVAEEPVLAPTTKRNVFKDVAMFLLAPFIGLLYLLTFPVVGFGIMAYTLYKGSKTARTIMQIIAAPFVTIAFVTIGPIVGLGMMAYFGTKAWFKMLA
jgi:CheY-like chemotaxis protein